MSDQFSLPESPMKLKVPIVKDCTNYEDPNIDEDSSRKVVRELRNHNKEYRQQVASYGEPQQHDGKYSFFYFGCFNDPENIAEALKALYINLSNEFGDTPEIRLHRSCAYSKTGAMQVFSYTLFYPNDKERGLYRVSIKTPLISTRESLLNKTSARIVEAIESSGFIKPSIELKPEREQ